MKSARLTSSPISSAPRGRADVLPVGGITPFTTVDFPGRTAAVFYTRGCAWNCRYCHNSAFRPFREEDGGWRRAVSFLETRRGLLDGVVFSGGEPTAHAALAGAMETVKGMGFEVALHTTGMHPERLAAVAPLCDWIGMDLKAPFARYAGVTGRAGSGDPARRSARFLVGSGRPHEFRTTVHPALLSEADVLEIARALSEMGARDYAVQRFRAEGCADAELSAGPVPPLSAAFLEELKRLFPRVILR
jgi:anaerobic ribonucleoside-triphosphate reductase activating protein